MPERWVLGRASHRTAIGGRELVSGATHRSEVEHTGQSSSSLLSASQAAVAATRAGAFVRARALIAYSREGSCTQGARPTHRIAPPQA
eukprot:scaffold6516_cov126-Isochrysis_galbana.AAC.2